MIYLRLFLSFMKIGFTSFGGMSMIPLILEEMQKNRWMTAEDLTNLVAIAEMTPGPLGINCATFTGIRTAGLPGGIIAVVGVLMPAFTLALLVAVFFSRFKNNRVMEEIMSFVKPICIAMILSVICTLSVENYGLFEHMDGIALAIGALMFFLIQKKHWSVPKVIGCSALLGIFLYGVI